MSIALRGDVSIVHTDGNQLEVIGRRAVEEHILGCALELVVRFVVCRLRDDGSFRLEREVEVYR